MLTVLFATCNRAKILARVLDTYCTLVIPPDGWEVIIVDNASTDDTRQVIESFQSRLPLRYLFEPQQGKNHALNHGLSIVTGDLVIFTDDDVFPRFDWLVQLRQIAGAKLQYDVFSGVTLPRWEVPPPDWILAWVPLGPTFTLSPPTLTTGPGVSGFTFGTNFAVRSKVFHAGYCFDVTIGPQGKNYPMGSETQFIRAVSRGGHQIWHSSDVVVEHWIEAAKLNKTWILSRAMKFGRGRYRMAVQEQPNIGPTWFGVPRFIVREALQRGWQVLCAKLLRNPQIAFRKEWDFMCKIGECQEARKYSFRR